MWSGQRPKLTEKGGMTPEGLAFPLLLTKAHTKAKIRLLVLKLLLMIYLFRFFSSPDYMRQGGGGGSGYPPRSGYDELDTTLMPPRPGEPYAGAAPPGGGGAGGAPPPNAPGALPIVVLVIICSKVHITSILCMQLADLPTLIVLVVFFSHFSPFGNFFFSIFFVPFISQFRMLYIKNRRSLRPPAVLGRR